MRLYRWLFPCLFPLAVLSLSACTSLPSQVVRPYSQVLTAPPPPDLAGGLASHPGLSFIQPLPSGQEALDARLRLIHDARRSLDVQYYLFHDDASGRTLALALRAAADRGVRVRLLLDDIRLQGADELLTQIDAHANIEVRIFNPFVYRSRRWLDFVGDFERVNHRMHNKSLTADGLYSIVGGRNIGDEYFAATLAVNFSDMDLLMAGPVVQEIGAFFDMYWNSNVVYPISALVEASHASAELPALPLRSPSAAEAHENGGSQSRTYWARAVAIADPPDKLHQKMDTERYAIAQMRAEFERAEREMVLISPYFVPGKQGVRWLADAVKRGVRVRVLTNSFAATDVSVVHAGYARYRHDLLRAGVELYELKPTVPDTVVEKSTTGSHSGRASLHAKVYLIDGRKVFVGSLNLDPRSIMINTEMGVVVESEAMYQDLAAGLEEALPLHAWRVVLEDPLDEHSALVWIDSAAGEAVSQKREPGMGPLQRFSLFLFGLLPVEPQL